MSQLMTLSQAAGQNTSTGNCPDWCESAPHADGSPHFGGVFDIDLSRAEPGHVTTPDGHSEVTDFIDVALWQNPGQADPVIGLSAGFGEVQLPDMTLTEAEALACALIRLVCRGPQAD